MDKPVYMPESFASALEQGAKLLVGDALIGRRHAIDPGLAELLNWHGKFGQIILDLVMRTRAAGLIVPDNDERLDNQVQEPGHVAHETVIIGGPSTTSGDEALHSCGSCGADVYAQASLTNESAGPLRYLCPRCGGAEIASHITEALASGEMPDITVARDKTDDEKMLAEEERDRRAVDQEFNL